MVPLLHASPTSSKMRRRRLSNTQGSDDEGDTIGRDIEDEWITVPDAVKLVRNLDADTIAPSGMELLVWQRVSRYPAAIHNHVHATKVYIPADIARALAVNPALVQKPIETFYTRDAIQLRAAHRMSRFPPEPSVLKTVRMTRTAYAQLVGQKFHPPKVFGRWQENEGTPEWRWRDIGMKIVRLVDLRCSIKKAQALKEALRRNPEYIKYIQNLVSARYFGSELEGSQQWNILEDKAASTFIEVRRGDDAARPAFSALLVAAISQSTEALTTGPEEPEDSEDWLNIDAQDFDDMLERTMGAAAKHHEAEAMNIDSANSPVTEGDRIASEQAARLQNLAQQVENFVDREGDIEGAKFEDEESSDEQFSDEKMSDSEDEGDDNPTETERRAAMDNLVPSLEPAEYGQMPALYHANSQRVAPTMETGVVENSERKVNEKAPKDDNPMRPIRQPILPRDKYDGVDSDDDTDDDDGPEQDDESDEDQPQVMGEIEVDMGQEEEEFLEFSRQALGISDEQWEEIVRDRKGRGAFVPSSATNMPDPSTKPAKPANTLSQPAQGRSPEQGPRPNVNPNLDSFESVMQAMDAELARNRKPKSNAAPSNTAKGKGKAPAVPAENDEDIETAMDAELKAMLEKAGGDDDDDDEGEEPVDYNLIKNFLESFKSQAGLAGPHSLVQKIFSLICSRPTGLCNFLDAPELEAFIGPKSVDDERWRVVYRSYATLYFVFVVDGGESELGVLDLIQVFVESLDRTFENVCELDLVFHFDEVHHILAEIIQGGLVLETNIEEIDSSVQAAAKARKESYSSANPLSLGVGGGVGPRGSGTQTPLGWITGKITGLGSI
ncbi:hypothetical protein HWV62_44458 [Athelia sp. TMB]|nr:hypothetical protein HWV62_44458 [Athelia sp. TMB]